jgi:hypothetical protein
MSSLVCSKNQNLSPNKWREEWFIPEFRNKRKNIVKSKIDVFIKILQTQKQYTSHGLV